MASEFRTYIIRRVLAMLVTFWGILSLIFIISRVMPGDPAATIAGPKATQEQIQRIREAYGINDPLYVQYFDFFRDFLFRLDLGQSIATERPVALELGLRFPATLELTTLAVIFAMLVGIPLGILSALEQNNALDHGSRILAISGVSLPRFWAAIVAQLVFYFYLDLLPVDGRISNPDMAPPRVTGMYTVDAALALEPATFIDVAQHMMMPVILLSLGTLAQVTRIMRSSMIDTLNEDFIEWSRAHGYKPKTIVVKHALRNAIMPTITAAGLSYGVLLGGSVVIEIIFNINGIGLFLYNGVISSDFNAIVGVTIMFAMGYLIVNFLVDLTHTYVNPEVEASG
ncbi:MAG: ABC transporter permease [Halobacteriales archaeon]|nr:ABC transporter permease [Halobacteriales archaeon]